MTAMALDGVKVLDFTWAIAGPMITKYLADFGATVIKVESSTRPDLLRVSGPFKDGVAGVDRSGVFASINPNKYSMSINMKSAKGVEVAKRLVAWADVVVENSVPGVMESWGLDYETLKQIKPDIIFLRSSAQGQTGPNAKLPAYGFNLAGLVGFVHITGWPDREPVHPYGVYTDLVTCPFGATAVMAALDHRNRTGEGRLIDLSQLEVCIQLLAPLIMDYSVNQRDSMRKGNVCDFAAPHAAYRCKGDDRWCAIGVFNDEQWQALCNLVGHQEWINDERFVTLVARKNNEAELDKIIEEWTINYDAEEVMNQLQGVGVPAGVLESPEEILNDAQLLHREAFWMLNHEVLGPAPHIGQPCKLSKTPVQGRMPAPILGEHTEMVCNKILEMSDEEFIELLSDGVLE